METLISLISDLSILVFDLTLYTNLTALKKDDNLHRGIMYAGTFMITLAYVIAVYGFHAPYAISSFLCMTIPSFLLFFWLSRYKNARFLVTFCFVDTVTLIFASLAKVALIVGGQGSGLISCIILLVLCTGTYLIVRPYCSRYRELMEQVSQGWGPMAVSTVLIYLLLVIFTAYPEPLRNRLEYLPVLFAICITVLSFYAVFIVLLLQKSKLMKANQLLNQQKHWHNLAYLDELTQLANTAAFNARTAEMEKEAGSGVPCALMMFDIDDFKKVNDTFGHLYGNTVLKKTAAFFIRSFPKENYEFFRVGGDEFAAISTGIPEKGIAEKTEWINSMKVEEDPGCTYSCGYAMVDFTGKDPFRNAFQKADDAMYAVKTEKKRKAGIITER